ncbi:hypothetical protein [Priestia koreensis]|uniref:hypothetical protein n=1 Tax=Priestia koreensis TaxID=284581 RepID=UPI0006A9B01E|nr:hypothetical protein [Priestia koreensis]
MPMMREIWTPFKLVGVRYFKDKGNGLYYRKVRNQARKEIRPPWRLKRFYGLTALLVVGIVVGIGYYVVIQKASDQLFTEVSKDVTSEDMISILHNKNVQQLLKDEVGAAKASSVLVKYSVLSTDAPESVTHANQPKETTDSSSPSGTTEGSSSVSNSSSEGNSSETPSSTNNGETQKESNSQKSKENSKGSSASNSSALRFESREEATRFVLRKFSISEVNEIRTLVQGNANADEKAHVKKLVYSRLSPSEVQALKVFSVIERANH